MDVKLDLFVDDNTRCFGMDLTVPFVDHHVATFGRGLHRRSKFFGSLSRHGHGSLKLSAPVRTLAVAVILPAMLAGLVPCT